MSTREYGNPTRRRDTHTMFVFSAERVRAHDFRDNFIGPSPDRGIPFCVSDSAGSEKGAGELASRRFVELCPRLCRYSHSKSGCRRVQSEMPLWLRHCSGIHGPLCPQNVFSFHVGGPFFFFFFLLLHLRRP